MLEPRFGNGVVCRSHSAVMNKRLFREGSGRPAVHPRGQHRNQIKTTIFELTISSNLLEALAPKKLTRPGNVIETGESIIVTEPFLGKACSGYSQFRI